MRNTLMTMVLCCFFSHVYAQDSVRVQPIYLHSGKIGVGIDGLTGSPNLLMKYFANNQLALQVIVGLDIDQPGGSAPLGTTKVTGLAVRGGLSLLVHLMQNQVSPYVGLEGMFQYVKQGGFYTTVNDPKNSVLGSILFGGECFINERFTVGIRQSIGVDVQLKRDIPHEETDITIATSTLISGRFYFN